MTSLPFLLGPVHTAQAPIPVGVASSAGKNEGAGRSSHERDGASTTIRYYLEQKLCTAH